MPSSTMMPVNLDVEEPRLPGFVERLPQACEGHEMGFHFEEGGCWGMALALAQALRNPAVWVGRPGAPSSSTLTVPEVVLRVRTEGFVHAFVEVHGLKVDHQGAWTMKDPHASRVCEDAELRNWAHHFGVSDQDLETDIASAQAVIETAMLWDVEPEPVNPNVVPDRRP